MTETSNQLTMLFQALKSSTIETTQTIPLPPRVPKSHVKTPDDQFNIAIAILTVVVGVMLLLSGFIGLVDDLGKDNRQYVCDYGRTNDEDVFCQWK